MLTAAMVVGPLADSAIDAIPLALREHLASEFGRQSRWRRRGGSWSAVAASDNATLSSLAEAALTISPQATSPLETLKIGFAHEFTGLPLHVYVFGNHVVFAFSHARFDGTSATAVVSHLLGLMAGITSTVAPRSIESRPLLVIWRRFRLISLSGALRARAVFRDRNRALRIPYQQEQTLTKAESIALTALAHVHIDAATAARIASVSDPIETGEARVRAPARVKIAALGLGALRDINIHSAEFRVVFPIDARRYLRRGTTVDGNLSPSVPLGLLMADTWTSSTLMRKLAASIKSGEPAIWLLATAIGGIRSIARGGTPAARPASDPVGAVPRIPFEIHVSLPSSAIRAPEQVWKYATDRISVGLPSHRTIPLGVWLDVVEHGDGFTMTLWDDSGLLDVDSFETALRSRTQQWISGAAER